MSLSTGSLRRSLIRSLRSRQKCTLNENSDLARRKSVMAQIHYCWRCKLELPMLDEREAEYVLSPMHSRGLDDDLESAKRVILRRYFEITGFEETNANAIFHHLLSQYGPPCSNCGKLLRTPRAKLCAACGV